MKHWHSQVAYVVNSYRWIIFLVETPILDQLSNCFLKYAHLKIVLFTAIYIVGLPANITTMLLLPVPVPRSLLPRGCRDRGKTAIYNLLIKLRNKLITIHNIFILVFCLPLLFGLPPKMMDPQSHALPPGPGHTASPIHPTLLPPTPIVGWLLCSLIVWQQPKASS